jgi:branched-chain amino acid transport system substrate-binding protein
MMKVSIIAGSIAAALAFSANGIAAGISNDVVKIGVLGDMSGMYSSGFSGPGAVAAVRMAVQDFGGTVLGKRIEVVYADHQNKADIASATARQWFDTDNVDMINDLTNSSVALSVQQLASNKKKLTIATGPGSVELTGKARNMAFTMVTTPTHWQQAPLRQSSKMVETPGLSWRRTTLSATHWHKTPPR